MTDKKNHSRILHSLFLILLLMFNSQIIEASQIPENSMATNTELMNEVVYENQFQLGLAANIPYGEMSEFYEVGEITAQGEYSSFLKNNWMLGFGGGYQNLNHKITGKSLAIAKIFQRSRKLYRLYHPIYFAIGFEVSYLFPAKSQDFIPELEEDFESEIGAGLTNSFIFRFSTSSLMSFNFNIWRGTGSRKLKSVEVGLMFGKSI
jgi:hypothetical protein